MINFRQIEAFRAIMIHGSVTRAGEALHISQPAVSRLLADFEQSLGVKLFERGHGRLMPTAEAQLLYKESEVVFGGISRLNDAALSLRELRRGRIRIVSEVVYMEGFLPRLAAEYQAEHPDVQFELDTGPSASIVQWIELSWYDLGIVVLPTQQADIEIQRFQDLSAVCAVPSSHSLADRKLVSLKDLEGENFVAHIPDTAFRIHIDRAFLAAGVVPRVCIEARTQFGMCTAVKSGAGFALVDPCVVPDAVGDDIVFLECEDPVRWETAMITPRVRPSSLVCRDFMSYLYHAASSH